MAWAALMFFAVLASYFVLRPVRDALVLDGDMAFIPALFTATFVVMIAIAPLWGGLVARLPRERFVPIVYRCFLINLLAFYLLVRAEVAPAVIGRVFYVWVSVFNLFVVSVFWSLCADVARTEQGRRLFGPIAAGGTVGALVGPLATRFLVGHVGVAGMLLVSAALLEASVWAAHGLDRAARRLGPQAAAPATRPIGGAPLAGLREVVRSPFLAAIAAYVVCAACLATFVYLEQAEVAKHALRDRDARTAYFANVELWTGVATLALQVLFTARLLRWLGAGAVLAILPVVQGAGAIALTVAPSLVMAATVAASTRAVTHAFNRPARELLFTAVAREDKYKAKNVIDTLVYRFGDFASSWLHRGMSLAGVAIAPVAVPLAAVWLAVTVAIGAMFRRRTEPAPP